VIFCNHFSVLNMSDLPSIDYLQEDRMRRRILLNGLLFRVCANLERYDPQTTNHTAAIDRNVDFDMRPISILCEELGEADQVVMMAERGIVDRGGGFVCHMFCHPGRRDIAYCDYRPCPTSAG